MMMINDILDQFAPVGLAEMDKVKLMNRTETKFLLTTDQLPQALQRLEKNYYCQENISKRIARYETLYYDTPDFSFYLKHHNGELNRYKVRHRTYLDSGLGFLEIKYRNNKGRSIKQRIKEASAPETFTDKSHSFLTSQLSLDPSLLQPAVTVSYSRITLVSKHRNERVTIDTGIEFRRNGELISLGKLAIAETKQNGKISSAFHDNMKNMKLYGNSFSKYCLAIAMMCGGVKKNNFKENLLTLKYMNS